MRAVRVGKDNFKGAEMGRNTDSHVVLPEKDSSE